MAIKQLTEADVMNLPSGLGYDRKDLPQIPQSNLAQFIRKCQKLGVKCEAIRCLPSSLKPSQGHLNKDKINSMKANGDDSPYVISKDKYIADGHHRWASKLVEGDTPIRAIKIGLGIHDLIKVMNAYQGSFSKGIHEGVGFKLGLPGKSPYKGFDCKNTTCKNDANFKCVKCGGYMCANHASHQTVDWDAMCAKCMMANQLGSKGGWISIPTKVKDGQ